ncbi:hypothetical protein GGR00_003540 [Aminobacter aganoensis]|uniref:Uncharacterized protein n=1 Tax=Aminobacter aganoensis TaxID=83264 RepID=A0A7X0F9Y8_9HYPH|nr:hypothetical protein [Aminobacter aganoensis]
MIGVLDRIRSVDRITGPTYIGHVLPSTRTRLENTCIHRMMSARKPVGKRLPA